MLQSLAKQSGLNTATSGGTEYVGFQSLSKGYWTVLNRINK